MSITVTGSTRLMCLLGSPVSHSISPLMHNMAIEALGLNYTYMCFDVAPAGLKDAVSGLRTMNTAGFNVTMPNKTEVIKYLNDISDSARLCGSVNTVENRDGLLIGHNTDGAGYFRGLNDYGYDVADKTITIMGDGGAATAICAQAALYGAKRIHIFCLAPIPENTLNFKKKLEKYTEVSIDDISDKIALLKSINESSLLINATPVGMGKLANDCLIDGAYILESKPLVSDVIYNPAETKLLKYAKEAGCVRANGLSMLLYQGVYAFKIWTGLDMPLDLVRNGCFPELAAFNDTDTGSRTLNGTSSVFRKNTE